MKTYVIASTVVFDKNGKLLVLRRSADDEHRPGELDLPGGEAEESEKPFEAAVRELVEETGLQIAVQDVRLVFGWANVRYHTVEKTDVNFVQLGFIAKFPADQTIQLSFEHQGFSWMSLDEALRGFTDRPSKKNFLQYLRKNNLEPALL